MSRAALAVIVVLGITSLGHGRPAATQCDARLESTLPGVRFEMAPQSCAVKVKSGLKVDYTLVIEGSDLTVVPRAQDDGECDRPEIGGLIVFGRVKRKGKTLFCLCDTGLCQPPSSTPITLKPGRYPGSFVWHGRVGRGGSDTGDDRPAPRAKPGPFSVELSAIGQHLSGTTKTPFRVSATVQLTLSR